jgi:signal transduction histidine kinase
LWQFSYVNYLLLGSGVFGLLMTSLAWQRRRAPGAAPLAVLSLAVAVYAVGYSLEIAAPTLGEKVFWAKVQYLGISITPTLWLAVALQYAHGNRWFTQRNLILLSVMPTVTLIMAWTNDSHGLIWSSTALEQVGSLNILALGHGAVFWLHTLYSYGLLLLGSAVLGRMLRDSSRLQSKQTIALLISAVVPWVTSLAALGGLTALPGVNPVPLSFIISGAVLTWAIYQERFLDITPLARNAVFQSINNGVLVLDAHGRIIDSNDAAGKVMRKPAASMIGRLAGDAWPEGARLLQRSDASATTYVEFSAGEGDDRRTYDVAFGPVQGDGGALVGRLVVFNDVTERKAAEDALSERTDELQETLGRLEETQQQLIQSEKLAGIGQLIAGVAHELNNPLSVVAGYAEMLQSGIAKPEDLERIIESLNSETQRAIDIVRGLLTFSRPSPPYRESISINAVVNRALELWSVQSDANAVQITLELQPDLPQTMADFNQMQQVFTNLIMNAGQAMSEANEGGNLTIKTELVDDVLRIAFKDDGPGIPEEHISKVFDPFFTTKERGKGTGLGLSICYGIVNEHGGKLTAASQSGAGATFTVELPLTAGDAPSS